MGTITSFGDRTSGTLLIIASVSPTKITRTDNSCTLVYSYRWVLHYFSTMPVGRIKIVTVHKFSKLRGS